VRQVLIVFCYLHMHVIYGLETFILVLYCMRHRWGYEQPSVVHLSSTEFNAANDLLFMELDRCWGLLRQFSSCKMKFTCKIEHGDTRVILQTPGLLSLSGIGVDVLFL
jgi:hypothetical protein